MANKENLILFKLINALLKAGKAYEVEKIIEEMLEELETKRDW